MRRRRSGVGPWLLAAVLGCTASGLAACSDTSAEVAGGSEALLPTDEPPKRSGVPDDPLPTGVEVGGSVEQVWVVGAPAGARVELVDEDGERLSHGRTDEQGSHLFRNVEPGRRRVVLRGEDAGASAPVVVRAVEDSAPGQPFYEDQELQPGYQYIETRDGTELAASVYLPGPVEDGPYPTVVEYSGYDPARPGTNLIEANAAALRPLLGDDLEVACQVVDFACDAPAQPASLMARALGYAVVAVNMRGTGCSGGAYDFFEPLQLLDGYDVIETVAAQPWVKGGKVGMVGLSYPGISQLFVASTQPPSLAAITPMSVFDDVARGVLAPGGYFNDGFALAWARNVGESAEPYGQGWERALVDAGDETCERNQMLRGQNVDAVAKARTSDHYIPSLADPVNPSLFVDRIEVPVFLTGAYQDEQTGGRFPMLFDDFDRSPLTRFTAFNGAHADGFAPFDLVEWKTFLDLYVADELSPIPGTVRAFAPLIMQEIFKSSVQLPPERFLDEPDVASARAAYEAERPIRLVFENGAGDPDQPGAPVPTAEVRVDSWPPAGTRPVAWYLQPDGSLDTAEPDEDDASASRFRHDPQLARTRTTVGDSETDLFAALPAYDWRQEPEGSAAVFLTPPLDDDVVLAGSASADLWVRTDIDDADLGVTLSEVRPDGKETFIQAGVMRAMHRKVAEGSNPLLPLHTGRRADARPLPTDEFTEVRVEIFPFAHILREGSRLRLSVHTPGGDRPRWTYILPERPPGTTVDVGHSADTPSRLVLPVTQGLDLDYPDELPPCPGLRGQPCRDFVPYRNTPAPRS